MNYLKRALLSVRKHMVKNIMLVIAFSLIATMLFCGISINFAVNEIQNKASKSVGAEVGIKYDVSKAKKTTFKNGPSIVYTKPLSGSLLKQLDSIKHVAAYNHKNIDYVYAKNFNPIYNTKIDDIQKITLEGMDENTKKMVLSIDQKKECILENITDTSLLDEFSTGTYRILTGRHITKSDVGKNVAVIDQGLAEKNNLKLGSRVEFQGIGDKAIKLTYTVVGISKAPPAGVDTGFIGADPADTIFVPFNTGNILETDKGKTPDAADAASAIYYLDSPQNIAQFEAAAKKIPGMENYIFVTNDSMYKRITSSLAEINRLSSLMMIILLAAGALILALIIALSLKGRRREMGILLAVGEKKQRLIIQIFVETLIPVIIAFCVGVFASGFISQKICDKYVTDSVASIQHQDDINMKDVNFLMTHKEDVVPETGELSYLKVTPVSKVNVSVSSKTIGEFAGCGLLIVLISILFPIIKILRLSPMAILSKRE